MKNYEDIAKRVLERRDACLQQQQKRRQIIMRGMTAAGSLCACLVIGAGIYMGINRLPKPHIQPPVTTTTSTVTTTVTSPTDETITTQTTAAITTQPMQSTFTESTASTTQSCTTATTLTTQTTTVTAESTVHTETTISYIIPEGPSTPEMTTTSISSSSIEETTASVPATGTTTEPFVPESTSTTTTTTRPIYQIYDIVTVENLSTYRITGYEIEPLWINRHLPRSFAINSGGTEEEHTIEVQPYGLLDQDPQLVIAVKFDTDDGYYIARKTTE